MRKQSFYIVSFFVFVLLVSCATKKNTKTNRFIHAFTTRYNVYFNGKTAYDEALKAQTEGYTESYSEPIYMFPISAQPKDKSQVGGAFDRAVEKSQKAIKLHSIQTKPAKTPGWKNDPKKRAFMEQQEYNPFIHNAWLLLGKSQFYNADFLQASATFSYITRHFAHDKNVVAEAQLWKARCYSEMNWLFEAGNILNQLNQSEIPPKQIDWYTTVYADYLIKNGQQQEALPYLIKAIRSEKNKRQKSRMKYLLGQLYMDLDQDAMAYQVFGEVAKSSPVYELRFSARIRQSEVFASGDYQKILRLLKQMARSSRNKDFLDQVYFAIGNVYLTRQDTAKAIENYQIGIHKSTRNGVDKAICQLRLGDLYFSMREYVKAQPCFSGARSGLKKQHKAYGRVSRNAAILDELVVHTEAVHLQDSLQALVRMPEAERMAVIQKIADKVKKEEEEAKAQAEKEAYLAEQESQGSLINRGNEVQAATGITSAIPGESSFYFYNTQTVATGKADFQRRWGRRKLEDDWRRRKKELSVFSAQQPEDIDHTPAEEQALDDIGAAGDSVPSVVASSDPTDPAFYLQQLPFTPEDIEASDLIIQDGLYHMAKIYKDQLEDYPLAIETFDRLNTRFPAHENKEDCYYQLYLLYLKLNDRAMADTYRKKLIADFPQSDLAIALSDPDYERKVRMMDMVQDSLYATAYNAYLHGDIRTVRARYQQVCKDYPLATLMPKFMFLDALTYVQTGDADGFKQGLTALLDKFPAADVSELAREMLKGVLRGRAIVQGGSMGGMTWNLRFGIGDDGTLSVADSMRTFVAEPNTPYRLLLVYPTEKVDKNQLLFAVAAYNFSNFMVKQFDLSMEHFGAMSMLQIKGFVSLEEILQYYRMIHQPDGYVQAIDKQVAVLPISDDNYDTLIHGKTLDEYVAFFDENWSEKVPDVLLRWQQRTGPEETEEKTVQVTEDETGQAPRSTLVPDTLAVRDKYIQKNVVPQPVSEKDSLSQSVSPVVIEPVPVSPVSVPDTAVLPALSSDIRVRQIDVQPAENGKKELTLKDIEAIRKKEAAQEAARLDSVRKEAAAQKLLEAEKLKKSEAQREALAKKQQAEDDALLKSKKDREKELEKQQKQRLKQTAAERKRKLKEKEAERKQKEKEYNQQLKQKEKERREKERVYKAAQLQKEKERKAYLKQKEKERKKKK